MKMLHTLCFQLLEFGDFFEFKVNGVFSLYYRIKKKKKKSVIEIIFI